MDWIRQANVRRGGVGGREREEQEGEGGEGERREEEGDQVDRGNIYLV